MIWNHPQDPIKDLVRLDKYEYDNYRFIEQEDKDKIIRQRFPVYSKRTWISIKTQKKIVIKYKGE